MQNELNLIRKIVWSYVRGNPGLEYEEVFSEACLAYLEALPRYKADKGTKSTFTWHVVHSHLNNLLKREGRYKKNEMPTYITPEAKIHSPSPEHLLCAKEHWEELLESLSPEGKVLCEIALYGDVYLPISTPRKSRGILAKELAKRGWKGQKIWGAFRELKEALSPTSRAR